MKIHPCHYCKQDITKKEQYVLWNKLHLHRHCKKLLIEQMNSRMVFNPPGRKGKLPDLPKVKK